VPRFSANISTLFREVSLFERIGLVAAAGFDAIEIQFPYDQDPAVLRAELETQNLPLVLMNFPVGDLMAGGEGLAAVPGREVEFEQALSESRKFAEVLRPAAMNLLAGKPDLRHDRAQCRAVFESSLRKASALTRQLGIQLLTEPVNSIDLPGFFLSTEQQTLDLIDAMPDIDLRMQYDLYHMQMMGSDLLTSLPEVIDRVGHIQFSDLPGRTEPGLGIIDFEQIFKLIDALGYQGYVGAEYFPTVTTSASLDWLKPYR
jgi:hydroxypyruvate isomerase